MLPFFHCSGSSLRTWKDVVLSLLSLISQRGGGGGGGGWGGGGGGRGGGGVSGGGGGGGDGAIHPVLLIYMLSAAGVPLNEVGFNEASLSLWSQHLGAGCVCVVGWAKLEGCCMFVEGSNHFFWQQGTRY